MKFYYFLFWFISCAKLETCNVIFDYILFNDNLFFVSYYRLSLRIRLKT